MSGLTFRRMVTAVALLVALVTPARSGAESAAPSDTGDATISVTALFNQVWDFLTTLSADAGCGLDPSGYCLPEEETAESDEGCGLDPSGHCGS